MKLKHFKKTVSYFAVKTKRQTFEYFLQMNKCITMSELAAD